MTVLAPARDRTRVMVAVPVQTEGRTCWAKALSGVDPDQDGGYALHGAWLDRGAYYTLPEGMLVVSVEKLTKRPHFTATLTLWRVDGEAEGGLDLVKSWTNKRGKIGPQMLTGVASRLRKAKPPRPMSAYTPEVPAPVRATTRAWHCDDCRRPMPPRRGEYTWIAPGRSHAAHAERCPPRRNTYPDTCGICSGWIREGQGALVPASEDHVDRHIITDRAGHWGRPRTGKWRVVHLDRCPEIPEPKPEPPPPPWSIPNRWPGLCEVCRQEVPARGGVMVGEPGHRRLMHRGDCPENPYNRDRADTWIIREVEAGEGALLYDYPAGVIARVQLPDAPEDAPGYRPMVGGASVVGVVTAVTVGRHRWEHPDPLVKDTWEDTVTTVWRLATPEEAAPILAREDARATRTLRAARARRALTLFPGAPLPDAVAPSMAEADAAGLHRLPVVGLPEGTAHHHTRLRVDEQAGVVWTIVHNADRWDDWRRSNFGGYIAYAHPLTPERHVVLDELRGGRAHHPCEGSDPPTTEEPYGRDPDP